jgi:hypothetical protein
MDKQEVLIPMPKWKDVKDIFTPSPKYKHYYEIYNNRREPEFEKWESDEEQDKKKEEEEEEEYMRTIKKAILNPNQGKTVEFVNPCTCYTGRVGFRHICDYCKSYGGKGRKVRANISDGSKLSNSSSNTPNNRGSRFLEENNQAKRSNSLNLSESNVRFSQTIMSQSTQKKSKFN